MQYVYVGRDCGGGGRGGLVGAAVKWVEKSECLSAKRKVVRCRVCGCRDLPCRRRKDREDEYQEWIELATGQKREGWMR